MIKYRWRITKYDPRYRDDCGIYLKDEWIMYSQIGKSFDRVIFTAEEYYNIEQAYINAILLVMQELDLDHLFVQYFSTVNYQKMIPCNLLDKAEQLFKTIRECRIVTLKELSLLVQLILRDYVSCQLYCPSIMYVHFGWDYYMYIGSYLPCNNALLAIERLGLFVENCKSPY